MAESWDCSCVGEGTPKHHLDNCGTRVVPFSDYERLRDALAEQAETIERLTAALTDIRDLPLMTLTIARSRATYALREADEPASLRK